MQRNRIIPSTAICLFTLLLGNAALARGGDFDYPPTASLEEVAHRIEKAPTTHPRLMATAGEFESLRGSLDSDRARRMVANAVLLEAGELLDVPPIKHEKQGRRLLGQSRRCVKRTTTLAMAFHLSGEKRFVDRSKEEMLAVARFSDWNPSHFLDVAEMTFGMAIGYDWLYNELDEASRGEIRRAIIEKGVTLPFTTGHKGWVRATNNWGQVCHGGLTAGAIATLEDEPELAAKTVHNALRNVTRSMAAYAPNGSYPEGPGYWSYGTTYNVLLVDILESVLGTDFGLTQAPGFDQTGQYLSLTTGPSGLTFNYADGGSGRRVAPILFWFAQRYDRPDWLLGEHGRLMDEVVDSRTGRTSGYGGRFLPLVLLWMKPEQEEVDVDVPLSWSSEGETPVTVHRSSWTDPNRTFVGVKAGSPSGSHGQMDVGSFVLDADGVRWALDLGAEGYHGIESRGMNLWSRSQNSDRWTIFRQMNHGHNTLVIDDQLQQSSGHGKIVEFSDDPQQPYTVVDVSDVYAGQAESITRKVSLLPTGEVLVEDKLSGLKPGAKVRWGMVTPGKPEKPSGTSLVLRQGNAELTLTKKRPNAADWKIIDTQTPRNEWDSPNRGTCMVAFEAVAPDSGELHFLVLITPGSRKKSTAKEWSSRSPCGRLATGDSPLQPQ